MNANDILLLVRAGYSKEEIDAMERENPEPAQAPNPEPAQAPSPEPAEYPQVVEKTHIVKDGALQLPEPAEQKAPPAAGTELDRLYAELRNLTAAIQQSNRAAADMGANIIDPQAAGMDALASLGNLTINKEGTK